MAVSTEIVRFESDLLGCETYYRAILPESRQTSGVLYLLHGLFGSPENWIENTDVIRYAASRNFLIICPDGGDNWYTDNPAAGHQHESFILDELIPHAEGKFNIGGSRGSRAIAGISMGGYGAFKMAFHRPELFCLAASLSGAFHAAEIETRGDRWSELLPSIYNIFGEDLRLRKQNSLPAIVLNYPADKIAGLPHFYFDCGIEDEFLQANAALAELMRNKGITHEFRQFPGGHDWDHWNLRLENILEKTADHFRGDQDTI